jgi:hypothetical protein
MIVNEEPNLRAIARSVKSSLAKTEKFISDHKKTHSGFLITSMTFSSASTLVAGITSAAGPVVGSGIEGWRMACIAAAVLGFIATLSTGISQQLKMDDQLLEGRQCLGKLKALDTSITIGSRTRDEIIQEYEGISRNYPKFIS